MTHTSTHGGVGVCESSFQAEGGNHTLLSSPIPTHSKFQKYLQSTPIQPQGRPAMRSPGQFETRPHVCLDHKEFFHMGRQHSPGRQAPAQRWQHPSPSFLR